MSFIAQGLDLTGPDSSLSKAFPDLRSIDEPGAMETASGLEWLTKRSGRRQSRRDSRGSSPRVDNIEHPSQRRKQSTAVQASSSSRKLLLGETREKQRQGASTEKDQAPPPMQRLPRGPPGELKALYEAWLGPEVPELYEEAGAESPPDPMDYRARCVERLVQCGREQGLSLTPVEAAAAVESMLSMEPAEVSIKTLKAKKVGEAPKHPKTRKGRKGRVTYAAFAAWWHDWHCDAGPVQRGRLGWREAVGLRARLASQGLRRRLRHAAGGDTDSNTAHKRSRESSTFAFRIGLPEPLRNKEDQTDKMGNVGGAAEQADGTPEKPAPHFGELLDFSSLCLRCNKLEMDTKLPPSPARGGGDDGTKPLQLLPCLHEFGLSPKESRSLLVIECGLRPGAELAVAAATVEGILDTLAPSIREKYPIVSGVSVLPIEPELRRIAREAHAAAVQKFRGLEALLLQKKTAMEEGVARETARKEAEVRAAAAAADAKALADAALIQDVEEEAKELLDQESQKDGPDSWSEGQACLPEEEAYATISTQFTQASSELEAAKLKLSETPCSMLKVGIGFSGELLAPVQSLLEEMTSAHLILSSKVGLGRLFQHRGGVGLGTIEDLTPLGQATMSHLTASILHEHSKGTLLPPDLEKVARFATFQHASGTGKTRAQLAADTEALSHCIAERVATRLADNTASGYDTTSDEDTDEEEGEESKDQGEDSGLDTARQKKRQVRLEALSRTRAKGEAERVSRHRSRQERALVEELVFVGAEASVRAFPMEVPLVGDLMQGGRLQGRVEGSGWTLGAIAEAFGLPRQLEYMESVEADLELWSLTDCGKEISKQSWLLLGSPVRWAAPVMAREAYREARDVWEARSPSLAPLIKGTIRLCREEIDAVNAIRVVDASWAVEGEIEIPLSDLLREVVPTLAKLDPDDPQGFRPEKYSLKGVGRLAKMSSSLRGGAGLVRAGARGDSKVLP